MSQASQNAAIAIAIADLSTIGRAALDQIGTFAKVAGLAASSPDACMDTIAAALREIEALADAAHQTLLDHEETEIAALAEAA